MPRAEVGSTKWVANKMKSKGLQRLRWYCQVCQKQCRDENGFKCHAQSESHLRQMLVVGEHAGKHIADFSSQFQSEFVALLSRRFGTKRVFANRVYQEYIQDKSHLHMNSTRWVTLTEFVKHLGRCGIARVDETEKGWFLAWVDNSPKTLAKQEAAMKKERLTMSDEQRERLLIAEQIERAAAESNETGADKQDPAAEEGLKRVEENEKVVLSLSMKSSANVATPPTSADDSPSPSSSQPTQTTGIVPLKMNPLKLTSNPLKRTNVFKTASMSSSTASSSSVFSSSDAKKRPMSAVESIIMEEQERKRRKMERESGGISAEWLVPWAAEMALPVHSNGRSSRGYGKLEIPVHVSYDSPELVGAPFGRLVQVYQDDGDIQSMIKRKTYDIDLAGDGLPYDSSLPASQQCPQGTWICMKVLDIKPDHSSEIPEISQIIPLAGNLQLDDFRGQVDAEARLIIPDVAEFGIPSLEITLGGGYYLSQPQRAQFLFQCDETAQEPSLPVVKDTRLAAMMQNSNDVYTHVFTWTSRYACPIKGDDTPPILLSSWWSSLFADEAPQEESNELRPSKGKTVGIIIGSIAGTCVLLGGMYYLHSRRHSKAYDLPSPSELLKQWLSVPIYYFQQIPLSSISFSSVGSFIGRPFTKNRSRQYRYNPLFAEEYEIQDREIVDDDVVDLQAPKTSSRVNASRGSAGYGSI
ncbi:hypothetical protein Clacol_009242 [Clathrus columnatus]|uniref:DNA/RNA-binding protein Kin17 WH-like domain-containing protein n=1 Tax=Clathrus columnatus TaxID=1419009 RepID=A0AAV5AJZ0_9AGAM|nr:hypothetical protein Clacol_009242 [Clathrus columnatus]